MIVWGGLQVGMKTDKASGFLSDFDKCRSVGCCYWYCGVMVGSCVVGSRKLGRQLSEQ